MTQGVRGEALSVQDQSVELGQQITAVEGQAAEGLAALRFAAEQWEEYALVMRDGTASFEEASLRMGVQSFAAQQVLAGRRELDAFVGQLAREQSALFEDIAREVRSRSAAEVERLREERVRCRGTDL